MTNPATVSRLATILDADPYARQAAARCLELETTMCLTLDCASLDPDHLAQLRHGGYRWHEIGLPAHVCVRLVNAGLLRVAYRSRSTTLYALEDRLAAAEALSIAPTSTPSHPREVGGTTIPADLFAGVIGLEEERDEMRACLEASPPVSMLISGPPASAKTVLVAEISRLPGAVTIHGGAITASGLTQLLLDSNPPRYLIVDEADKGRPAVLNRLLSPIEAGLVTDLRYGGHREARIVLWVIMVANDPNKIDPALRSRLWPITLSAYADEATRRAVISGFLVQREGTDPELAREIAALVSPHTSDVRRARDVARLCQGDRRRAAHFAARLAT